MEKVIELSGLGKTWIFDIDGTIVKHNGYIIDGKDSFLPGAEEFLKNIPEKDSILFLTSRDIKYKKMTESFLDKHEIKYKGIIYDLPYGERILINDQKPSGLLVSYAINTVRNEFMNTKFIENSNL